MINLAKSINDIKANHRLLNNIGYLGLANVIYSFAQWAVLVITTKVGGISMTSSISIRACYFEPYNDFFRFWFTNLYYDGR